MPQTASSWRGLAAAVLLVLLTAGSNSRAAKSPVEPGQRWELFVDAFLVDTVRDATLVLHPPRRAEVVLVTDAPWEGPTSAYFTVLKDGDTIRLYYRG